MVNRIFTGISVIIFLGALGIFVYGILVILGKVNRQEIPLKSKAVRRRACNRPTIKPGGTVYVFRPQLDLKEAGFGLRCAP